MNVDLEEMPNGLYKLTKENKDEFAEKILQLYSPKNLNSAEALDIDWFLEECLYLSQRTERLSLDKFILGMIAFDKTEIDCYDHLLRPKKLMLTEGEVVTDTCLSGRGDIRRLRYTKAHECSHWILHRKYFSPDKKDYAFRTEDKHIACRSIENTKTKHKMTTEELIEWQANSLGASLLMPKEIFKEVTSTEIRSHGIRRDCLLSSDNKQRVYDIITKVSDVFEVSKEATKIRFRELGLIMTENEYYNFI